MKTKQACNLRKLLRQRFGMQPTSTGSGDGHECWKDRFGRTVHPVLRHKDINLEALCSLAWEFEAKGICQRRVFWQAVREI